jgi:hypothetical protein
VRSPPVLGQQFENVVDNRVLGFGKHVRLGEDGLRNAGAGIFAAKLGDHVVEVLLRAEALAFRHLNFFA